mmetsp:Transcript_110633/g.277145  ORF Transcript_110633/g.277145 Transcript_110633/m.277145 type:complete len:353 (+) Transcript_110633:127-1185(+)
MAVGATPWRRQQQRLLAAAPAAALALAVVLSAMAAPGVRGSEAFVAGVGRSLLTPPGFAPHDGEYDQQSKAVVVTSAATSASRVESISFLAAGVAVLMCTAASRVQGRRGQCAAPRSAVGCRVITSRHATTIAAAPHPNISVADVAKPPAIASPVPRADEGLAALLGEPQQTMVRLVATTTRPQVITTVAAAEAATSAAPMYITGEPAFGSTTPCIRGAAATRRVRGARHGSARHSARRAAGAAARAERRCSGARLVERPPVPEPTQLAFDASRLRRQIQLGLRTSSAAKSQRGRESTVLSVKSSGSALSTYLAGNSFEAEDEHRRLQDSSKMRSSALLACASARACQQALV